MNPTAWNPELIAFLVESNRLVGIETSPENLSHYVHNIDECCYSAERQHARNSVMAMTYVFARFRERLTLGTMLTLHSRQMHNFAENPGEYRTTVSDGAVAPQELMHRMEAFFDLYNAAQGINPSWSPLRMHYELLAICPFSSGNGQVARLVYTMDRLRRGLQPICILDELKKEEASFTEKRNLYYETFQVHNALRESAFVHLERQTRRA